MEVIGGESFCGGFSIIVNERPHCGILTTDDMLSYIPLSSSSCCTDRSTTRVGNHLLSHNIDGWQYRS